MRRDGLTGGRDLLAGPTGPTGLTGLTCLTGAEMAPAGVDFKIPWERIWVIRETEWERIWDVLPILPILPSLPILPILPPHSAPRTFTSST